METEILFNSSKVIINAQNTIQLDLLLPQLQNTEELILNANCFSYNNEKNFKLHNLAELSLSGVSSTAAISDFVNDCPNLKRFYMNDICIPLSSSNGTGSDAVIAFPNHSFEDMELKDVYYYSGSRKMEYTWQLDTAVKDKFLIVDKYQSQPINPLKTQQNVDCDSSKISGDKEEHYSVIIQCKSVDAIRFSEVTDFSRGYHRWFSKRFFMELGARKDIEPRTPWSYLYLLAPIAAVIAIFFSF